MTTIPGMYGHQMHIVVLEGLGDNKVVDQLDEWCWEVMGDEHAGPVRGVVDQYLCGGFWMVRPSQELMRMIGAGTNFASQTKLLTHMLVG